MKQETLEEFIKEVLQDEFFTNIAEYGKAERLIELGAKWQQERMYSEEDMKNAFTQGFNARYKMLDGTESRDKFMEQFKNK